MKLILFVFIISSCGAVIKSKKQVFENKIVKLEYFQIFAWETFFRLGVNNVIKMSGASIDSLRSRNSNSNFGVIKFNDYHLDSLKTKFDSLSYRLNELVSSNNYEKYGIDSNKFNIDTFTNFDYRGVYILTLKSNQILLFGRNLTNGYVVNYKHFKHNKKSEEIFSTLQKLIKLNLEIK